MITTKNPKRCHLSASGNFKSRVGCAVAQKNVGNSYLSVINKKVGLSPGQGYAQEASRRDTERKRQQVYVNKKENTLKKIQNKIRNNGVIFKRKKGGHNI